MNTTIQRLNSVNKVDEKGLKKSIEATLPKEITPEFDAFCEGLDLDEKDKFWLLGGFVYRKLEKVRDDPEEFFKFIDKVAENYTTNKKRKTKCSGEK